MKLFNVKKLALVAALIIAIFTGCKTDFDINASQENLSAGALDYKDVMPSAIATTAKIVATDFKFLQNWMGYWARSGSYQNDNEEESYQFTNTFPTTGGGNPWNDLYYNASSYNYVQQNAHANGAGFYEAIARIMKAHDFQILVDIYGNIPYSQALKGNDLRNPKYDKGVDIYNDLFRQLDTAIAILKDPSQTDAAKNAKITTNDLVFKGNSGLWVKFANTLKLRLLVHCKGGGVEVNEPAYTTSGVNISGEVDKITAEGSGFLLTGESAKINPGYSASKPNPFYRYFALNENGVLAGNADVTKANCFATGLGTASTPGYYRWNGDPREAKLFVKPDLNPDATIYQAATYQKGIPYGAVSGFATGFTGADLSSINVINTTAPNTGLTPSGASSDAWILTSVESLFLQAEAAERGITSGNAQTLLTDAVRESFKFLGLTTTQADNYIAGNATYPDVDYTATALDPSLPGGGLFTIISQKWFALNGIAPFEVWTDYRRTDVVIGAGGLYDQTNAGVWANSHSILSGAAATVPVRLFYPQSEYSFNEANVQAEGTIDVFSNRIFWDAQ
jgi:hypothetical protein